MSAFLDSINSPEDVKKLDYEQLNELAAEIRDFLVENVSRTGGHLASNLGVVELTLALHKVFNTPADKLIWDVGHQSYVHKIVTGRKDKFCTLRQLNGIAGFPKTCESEYDSFNTGHSSTSISAALGIAKARDIKKEKYSVVAVIGDGAMTGGMAFEALNDAGRSSNDLIVILNDNEMSISKNVGGLSRYLSKLRTEPLYFKAREDLDNILSKLPAIGKSAAKALRRAKGTIKYMVMPNVIFEELGFKYIGPINGHDIAELSKVLSRAKQMKGPVFLHVITQKGKGYEYAEKKPQEFHGISPFEIETGELKINNGPSYSDIFGQKLLQLAEKDSTITATTAAMRLGTGLEHFSKKFPGRFFDVGIAEGHAVTFSAGLAKAGMKPVVAIYSSFLQRAYDQILHDVAIQNLHVVIAIDRAGIVGEDGETHQGLYDLSFLSHMPNMSILAPASFKELEQMLEYAVLRHNGPIAIRYPRGSGPKEILKEQPVVFGKGVLLKEGRDITIAAAGNMVENALSVSEKLNTAGISAEVLNMRFVKPLDEALILKSVMKTGRLVTIEDNAIIGGLGSNINAILDKHGLKKDILILGYPDKPITHGSKQELHQKFGLDTASIVSAIKKMLQDK